MFCDEIVERKNDYFFSHTIYRFTVRNVDRLFVFFSLRFQTKRAQRRTFCVAGSYQHHWNRVGRKEEVVNLLTTIFMEYSNTQRISIYEYNHHIGITFFKKCFRNLKQDKFRQMPSRFSRNTSILLSYWLCFVTTNSNI